MMFARAHDGRTLPRSNFITTKVVGTFITTRTESDVVVIVQFMRERKQCSRRGLSWVDTHPLTRLDPFMDFMMASFLHLIQIIATHWFSLLFRSSQARSSSQAAAGEFYA